MTHPWPRLFRLQLWSLLLLVCLLAQPALGASLKPDRTEISIGDEVIVQIAGKPFIAVVTNWSSGDGLELLDKDSDQARLKGVQAGETTVKVKINGKTYKTVIRVSGSDGRTKPKAINNAADQAKLGQGKLSLAEMQRIGDLLKSYESQLAGAGLLDRFRKQDSDTEGSKPSLSDADAARLGAITEGFFKELGGLGLSVQKLQGFKDDFKAAGPGGSPLFPGQGAWDDAFLGTERALMMGRAALVQKLWMETLQDTFKNNPDAAVFGEIDIGSWVKMQLSGLGFEADIDFSSVSIDPDLNRWIVDQFQNKLSDHSSLGMIKADALLTAHGQATADVFIGDWGKTFAELDMLKRSKWKVIKVEKNPDGSLALDENGQPKIRMIEKPGAQLFWEVAFRKLEAVQAANGGKLPHELPNPHQFEVDHPKMGLDKEPMLSLEMLRHGIHDIEHGPYSRGQKLIKMLKYAERSYFMSKKAVAEFGFNPYAANDPMLAQAAEKIIANKTDPEKVADLLRALSGEDITADNVDAVTDKLVARAKTAMHDNAARALAFRLNSIARIDADDARQKAAEKLWRDLGTELDTYRDTSGEPPKIMVDAQEMAKAVMEGKLPPAELEAKANELHKLLNDAYKLPDSVIDRILMSDSVLKLKAYLRKLGWIEKSIDEFANKAKQKFPNVADFHAKVMELNEQLEKSTSGSGLLKAADWADNAFTVYDAYLNSDASEALLNASIAMGRIGAESYFPSLQIPLAVYDSLKSGSPKPLGMAVAFMYFPFAGQTYMVSGLMQRADVGIRDTEFYNALNKVLEITEFDTQGKITGFSLRNIIGKEIDSESISPPGNRKAIVALFTQPDGTFYTSPNFRYWSSLVPKQDDRFGRYENKLQNLRRFFGLSEDVRYMTVMLENFKAKSDALPQDKFSAQRQAALERMETQLTETLWIAMADMLESAARSVNVGELETKVKKYEEDLSLGDDDLGKTKGLIARIKQEIRQNSSLLRGENPYAVALIYDKFIKAYERVEALRKQIVLDIWHAGFGIDYVAAQSKPMKVLLIGGKSGAPALTGDPAKDVELAENALAAHRSRAEAMRADLTNALDRAVDADKDKDHLKTLGQIGLEWEHLLDDCAGRAAPNCEAGVRTALQQRVKLYKEYLAKLATGNQAMTLEITGPTEMKLGESADFSAKFAKPEDKSRPGLALNWSVNGQAAGNGEKLKVKAEQAGGMNLMLSATSKASGTEKKLGEAIRTVSVKDPTGGKPPATSANLAAEIDAALKARDWKRLVDRLDAENKSDLKMKNVVAWQANINALNAALASLRNERIDWALAWRPYIDALNHIDSLTWEKLTQQVEIKRNEVERRCWENSSSSEANDKRVARCQTEGRKFEESCVGTWPAQHWEEVKRIRIAKQELGDAVHLLHSVGYGGFRNWFEAVETLAEKHKLPFPYPKPVTPRLKYALSCASVDLTAGKKAQDSLSTIQVRVEIPSAIVPFGKPVTLNASASGGKSPYTFAWSTGASGQRALVTPRWAGEWTVTVTATDADGKTGEGQGTLVVSPAKFKMNGIQPQVFYGSQATLSLPGKEPPPPMADPCAGRSYTGSNPFDECLRIDVKDLKSVSTASPGYVPPAPGMVSDPNQVQALPETSAAKGAGKQRVDWESDAALVFAPPSSEGGNNGGRTQVTYSSMGQVKIWCAILEEIEGAFHTVGECDQEVVNVVAPSFSVSFTPPEGQGRIGQDIRLRIDSQPDVADELIDFRWLDPATSNRLELASNAREIAFKVKDAKPVVLKVLARVPKSGDSIADIGATYTGLQFEVKAWVEEPGTRPMMWDPVKGGLKPVPKGQYATHERIPLRAELQGGGAPSGLRWNWTVNDGTTISNPISQTPTVSRGSPGGIQAHVEARDSEGAVLGSTDVSASVIEVRDTPPAPVNPTVSLYTDRTSAERGEIVSFSANATGGKPPYRYVWQGASGQEAHATLATTRTGNLAVSVTVTDSKGKTGTARLDISVVASARDIAKEKAGKLAAQATQQAKAGDFEGAANSVEEANQHDMETARPVGMQVRDQAKQAATAAEKKRDFKTSGRLFEAARRIDQNDQAAHIGANNAVAYQQRQDGMLAKQRELAGHIARGDWHLAETSQTELQIIDEGLPGGLTPETRDLIKRYQDGQATYTRQVEGKRKDIAADIQAKRYGSARTKLAALRQTHLIPADEDWARGISKVIDQAEAESQSKSGAGVSAIAGNVSGKWQSSEGEVTLTQSGRAVKGGYSNDGGEIVGEVNGNVLEGYWIENSSGERCTTAKNGRYYWGRIRWTFEGGKFVGNWSYCDKPLPASGSNWTGERIGNVPAGYTPPANTSSGGASSNGDATSNEEWAVVETTPGMYRLDRSANQAHVARQANNPGGLQYAGLRLNRGLPTSGDFSAQVSFADARIDGGLNQIELQATFADGSIFYVVRDRERSGSHIWAPNLQGDAPCGKAGTLRMERRGETVTGYCDGRAIWSAPRKAALTRLQFVLQNNATNDPISVTFRDWRFSASTGAATATSANAGSLGSTPRITELAWLGLDEDRVGDKGNGKPNGTKDGHFRLSLNASGKFVLSSLSLWSANEKGDKAGGQIWHSKTGSYWMLGVFQDGRQLNASHVNSLGEFPGRVTLDLYANSSGWFKPDQWFLVEAEMANGTTIRQPLKLGVASAGHVMAKESRLKLADQIPSTDSARFRGNQRSDLVMHTGAWDRTPYFMAQPREFDLNLKRIDRACLAGDAKGISGWRVDNYLLFELFDYAGQLIKDGVVGGHEGVSRNGRRIAELGNGHDQGPCAINLTSFLPVGQPFRMKVSAMDYGGFGHVSDVWLLLDGEVTGSGVEVPAGRDYTYQEGGRDYTYREQAILPPATPATPPSSSSDAQSLEEAGKQLKDAVKELKNLFKW